ncbi:hypothetical protein [Amycolatopsis thailandensis]|uniref:hypothetical protein n=1 Tax=Amycolatopsis thailandensis TaxID=589330 RepID=UPI0036266BA2
MIEGDFAMRKFIVGSVLAAATITAFASSASAMEELVSRGTYPNQAAAGAACQAGVQRGEWDLCRYRMANVVTGTIELLTNR